MTAPSARSTTVNSGSGFSRSGRITYGQRKTWLHLPADWPWTRPWTPDLTASWQTIKTLPIPI
jgi:hypothetical protein